jgi:CRISPR system Cascade subunit CasA
MTDVCQYCLLDEPLISVKKTSGKTTKVPLPEVLAGLATGDITSFKSLQAHQRQPWHSFLTQLSAIGMARTGKESIPVEA